MTTLFPEGTTNATVLEAYGTTAKDKTFLITGVSPSSLGAHYALSIAQYSPARLILLSRTSQNLEEVKGEILKGHPETSIQLVQCDLSSHSSVHKAAAQITTPVDVLVNSASLMAAPFELSVDGVESHFAVGHVGHWLLFNLLLKEGKIAEGARVLNAGSGGYLLPGMPEGMAWAEAVKWDGSHPYERWQAYSLVKTANIAFSRAINEKFTKSHGITSYCAIPGAQITKLGRFMTEEDFQRIASLNLPLYNTAHDGLLPYLIASLAPSDVLKLANGIIVTETSEQVDTKDYGKALGLGEVGEWCVGADAKPEVGWQALWKVSEEITGENF